MVYVLMNEGYHASAQTFGIGDPISATSGKSSERYLADNALDSVRPTSAPCRAGSLYFFPKIEQAIHYGSPSPVVDPNATPKFVYKVKCKGDAWPAAMALAEMARRAKDDKAQFPSIAQKYWNPGSHFSLIEYLCGDLEVTEVLGNARELSPKYRQKVADVTTDYENDKATMKHLLSK